MDVDRAHAHALEEPAAEDLHVARQHEQLGAAPEQLEHRGLDPLLAALRHRHVVEGHARRAPRSNRKPETAATIPVRPAQPISRRAA